MALTVPPAPSSSFSEFGWIFHNNHLDSSIYHDDDMMEFSDSSADYQTTPPHNQICEQQQQSQNRSFYNGDNSAGMVTNTKFSLELEAEDVSSQSKEAWAVDYVKTVLLGGSSSTPAAINDANRKRKSDWMQQHVDFGSQLQENGPSAKIASKDRDRRKSLGRIQWPEELDLDLSAELMNSNQYSNDSLLNFGNLPVFKQEVPSPTNQNEGMKQPRSPHEHFTPVDRRNLSPSNMVRTQQMGANGVMNGGGNVQNNDQQGTTASSASSNGLSNFLDQFAGGNQGNENNESNNSGQGSRPSLINDEFRFQYVLAAATSIATKSNEETLTYLNQGQSYEIKLKKLGDLSTCRGKMMKSVVKICFHERRLQYMEREQMHIWQSSRPGERIMDIDIPLSYGLIHVNQTALLNTAEILWDPMKEVGVYIKVNCISTEFTPKKHGGEKGVPFRIQIETYLESATEVAVKPLHAAACQIKVFKLKGADRKHKQDRERIQKRPVSEQDKYQRSYDCTILNDIPSDNLTPVSVGSYSPEHIKRNLSPVLPSSPIHAPSALTIMNAFSTTPIIGNVSSTNGLCKVEQNVVSSQNFDSDDNAPITITKDSTPMHLTQWLSYHRLTSYASTFSQFSGCDLLRMSKDDLIQICGLADGIRMFNILHIKAITPRLTIYVSLDASNAYHALYLHSATTKELIQKLYKIPGLISANMWKFNASPSHMTGSNSNLNEDSNFKIYVYGPNNVLVSVTDEVLANFKDESLFALEVNPGGSVLMKAVAKKISCD